MVTLRVVRQWHRLFVILIITFSDTLDNARNSKTNWNQNNKYCNNDYYSCTSTTRRTLIDIDSGVVVIAIILSCQCLILLSC